VTEKSDLVAFLRALSDDEFLANPAFADPEPRLPRYGRKVTPAAVVRARPRRPFSTAC